MKRVITKRQTGKGAAFTLVELLTTLTVIGILLALLIPALNQVGKTAMRVKQKAQFHAIGTALEAFRNDYGDYPPSKYASRITPIATASHNLSEALLGRDGLGFHPASEFRGDGTADFNADGAYDLVEEIVYHAAVDTAYETAAQNLAVRRGPYLEVESANAVNLIDIAPGYIPTLANSYVLVDMFKINRNAATGKEVGMPILYYKANKMRIGSDPDPLNWYANTYNINDSYCSGFGFIENSWGAGLFSDDEAVNAAWFYSTIQNPNFPGPPARPYRAESFLLHSAGPDGLYGTADDMFNFDQDN